MEGGLLYIREKEISSDLGKQLINSVGQSSYLMVLVEIEPIRLSNVPMITDFKEIRLKKFKEKIEKWFRESLPSEVSFDIHVFEGKPTKNNPNYFFENKGKLNVFLKKVNQLRISPFLKEHFTPDQVRFISIEDSGFYSADYPIRI
ncbi:MAG: hypothetical protein R3277_10555 [Brumimicrobium sp.]|nr:hypothetical protein [Brumimicrobium sp.]